MRELTVENIKKYMEADASAFDGVKGFGAISETSTLCLCIDFLIRETELYKGLLEAEQEDCQIQRKNKNHEWRRAENLEIVITGLNNQLATVERETAEWCRDLSEDMYNHSNPAMCTHEYNDDIAKRINAYYHLEDKK